MDENEDSLIDVRKIIGTKSPAVYTGVSFQDVQDHSTMEKNRLLEEINGLKRFLSALIIASGGEVKITKMELAMVPPRPMIIAAYFPENELIKLQNG